MAPSARRYDGPGCRWVQVLAGANSSALAVALACGASFVELRLRNSAHVADEGLIEARAGALLRYRRAIGADRFILLEEEINAAPNRNVDSATTHPRWLRSVLHQLRVEYVASIRQSSPPQAAQTAGALELAPASTWTQAAAQWPVVPPRR